MEIKLHNTNRILVLGESGTGKTYLVKKILLNFRRSMVITPQHEEFKEHPNRIVTFEEEEAFEGMREGLKQGNMIILIDDSDILLKKIVNDKRFKYLLMGGRHRGVGWLIISRRTTDIPTLCFKQANKLFLFQTDLPHDIKLLNDFYNVGDHVKDLNREAYEFLFLDREANKVYKMHA